MFALIWNEWIERDVQVVKKMRSQSLLFWTLHNCLYKLSALNTEQSDWKSFGQYRNVKKYKKPEAIETFCLALNFVRRNNFCFSIVTCIDLMELNSKLEMKLCRKRFSIFMWFQISFRWIYLKQKFWFVFFREFFFFFLHFPFIAYFTPISVWHEL